MIREAVILSMRCSPKADSLGNPRSFKAQRAPSPTPLLPQLVPSTVWTELSSTSADKFGGNKSIHSVHRLVVWAFQSHECVNGRQGQELLVLQEPIAYLLGLTALDSFLQLACCFAHEHSPPFAGHFIHWIFIVDCSWPTQVSTFNNLLCRLRTGRETSRLRCRNAGTVSLSAPEPTSFEVGRWPPDWHLGNICH
jgi:hypothetical protein